MHYTVCMPSHNRGTHALRSVEWMRERLPEEVDILVVDNGSTSDTEGYDALRARDDVRVVSQPNKGFLGSFNACLTGVTEGVAIFTSDEDVIPPSLFEVLDTVEWDTTSIVRGSVAPMDGVKGGDCYAIKEAYTLPKGADALCAYIGTNSYTSGTCYNLRLFEPVMSVYTERAAKHVWYPHLYLDALGCMVGDVRIITEASALEGEASDEGTPPSQYNTQYSIGSRIDHHVVLRDAVFDAMRVSGTWDLDTFARAYMKVCERTIRLITMVNRPQYADARLDADGCRVLAATICLAAIRDFKHCAPAFAWIEQGVKQIAGLGGRETD